MAAPLTSVPTELLQDIANRISRHDLLHLRTANREVAARVDDVFVERFFTTRRHLVTKHSLEKLAEMTAVPRLNRKMKKLEIVITSIVDHDSVKPRPLAPETKADADWMHIASSSDAEPKTRSERLMEDLEALRLWTERKAIYAKWYAERSSLSGGIDTAMLSKTFGNLKKWKVALEFLEITNDYAGAFGVRALEMCLGIGNGKNKDRYGTYFARFYDHSTVPLILRSLAETQYAVHKLCLGTEFAPCFFADFVLDDGDLDRLLSSFATLKTLGLGMRFFHHSSKWSRDRLGLSCLARLLKAANGLRKVTLSFGEDTYFGSGTGLPGEVLNMFADNNIESIILYGGSYHHRDLCDFFAKHKSTLTELDIDQVDMPRTADWKNVFRALATHEHMQYLGIGSLSRNYKFMDRWSYEKGPEEVQRWMRELAETAKFRSTSEDLYGTDSDSE